MVTKVNGWTKSGSFGSVGKGELVSLYTIAEAGANTFDVDATGVIATRTELAADGLIDSATLSSTNSITLNGTTYTANATYDAAYAAQYNLDLIVNTFAPFANPVYLDVRDTDAAVVAGTWTGKEITLGFEQKGAFTDVPGSGSFTRGEPSIGASADNYGSSQADIFALLDGLLMLEADASATEALVSTTNYEAVVRVSPNLQS